MELSRYRDKSYLVNYELTIDIFESFGLIVDDIVPVRSVFMLYTNKGAKILKKIDYSLGELEYINSLMRYVNKNGYKYIAPFMNTVDGNFYLKRPDGIYVVIDLIEGREADFQNPIDLSSVSKALCRFHNSTRGFTCTIEKRNNLNKWIMTFERRASDLVKFREIASLHEIKTGFDNLYLKYVDEYLDEAKESITLLKESPYPKLCTESYNNKNVCHHDLAYHNIIINSENDVYLVDFDYCIADLRIHDIGNLIVKAIKNCKWDIEKAKKIIEDYSSVDALKSEELQVLYDFLIFPQDFYDISRCYYMKTKNWDEYDFLSRLETKAGYYDDRKTFFNNFKQGIAF
ncbi:MAG: CotS family spore coat protein [Clostridiales bacterium]|nr:CotS family spore coat protein [Clostridiales bacterium]